jgi:hypothetical protein
MGRVWADPDQVSRFAAPEGLWAGQECPSREGPRVRSRSTPCAAMAIREPFAIAAAHPAVAYRAFDLGEAGLDHIQQMLVEKGEVGALFERGVLRPLPSQSYCRTYDERRSPFGLGAATIP